MLTAVMNEMAASHEASGGGEAGGHASQSDAVKAADGTTTVSAVNQLIIFVDFQPASPFIAIDLHWYLRLKYFISVCSGVMECCKIRSTLSGAVRVCEVPMF